MLKLVHLLYDIADPVPVTVDLDSGRVTFDAHWLQHKIRDDVGHRARYAFTLAHALHHDEALEVWAQAVKAIGLLVPPATRADDGT